MSLWTYIILAPYVKVIIRLKAVVSRLLCHPLDGTYQEMDALCFLWCEFVCAVLSLPPSFQKQSRLGLAWPHPRPWACSAIGDSPGHGSLALLP